MWGAGWGHPRGPRVLTVSLSHSLQDGVRRQWAPRGAGQREGESPLLGPTGLEGGQHRPTGGWMSPAVPSHGDTRPQRVFGHQLTRWPCQGVPVVGGSPLCQGVTPLAVSLGAGGGNHRAVPTWAWLPAPFWGREWAMGQRAPRPPGCPLGTAGVLLAPFYGPFHAGRGRMEIKKLR